MSTLPIFCIRGTDRRTNARREFFCCATTAAEALQQISRIAFDLEIIPSADAGIVEPTPKPEATSGHVAAATPESSKPASQARPATRPQAQAPNSLPREPPTSSATPSWWWPRANWASLLLLAWLFMSAAGSAYIAGPTGAFINTAAWYLMFIGCRFVYIQATRQ